MLRTKSHHSTFLSITGRNMSVDQTSSKAATEEKEKHHA
jgi:hypothetical protein